MIDPRVRVAEAAERLAPHYTSLLRDLVQLPSTRGLERDAQAVVARWMREIGLEVDSFDVDARSLHSHPGFNRTASDYTDRPNVVGRRRGAGGGRSLLLNAHIDTVPVEQAEAWTHGPLAGDVENGRLYGRGACDDKAGVVECLLVAHAIKNAGVTLRGDLTVVSVIEDETSGNGTLATVARGYRADGVVIVDGTWPERYIVSHMGQVTFQVRIRGVAGHASSTGPNPIDAIGSLVDRLRALVGSNNSSQPHAWGDMREPFFINFGRVSGGIFPGSVPAECVIEGQYGFPPPHTRARAQQDLVDAITSLGRDVQVTFEGLSAEPFIGDPNNDLVRLLRATVERRQGAVLRESVIRGHHDLRHYVDPGGGTTVAGCLYGPGGGRNVHGADEYFELAHLPLVAANLASLAIDWCGIAE